MLLNASTECTIIKKKGDEVKNMIENMCQNEYRTQSDRAPKKKGMIEHDTQTTLFAQLKLYQSN